MHGRTWLAGALAVLLCGTVGARPPTPADFARHPALSDAALSPDGRYIALAVPTDDGSETQLQVVRLDDSGRTQVLRFGKRQHVTDLVWTDDGRITVSRAKIEPLKARPVSFGELMSADADGGRQETLFAYIPDDGPFRGRRKDQGFARIEKVLDGEPGMALVSYRCWNCGEEPDSVIFKVDTATGRREEVERIHEPADLLFDGDGEARIAVTWDEDDNPRLRYRPRPGTPWQPMPKSLAGYSIGLGRFAADRNTLYATVSDAGEPAALYRLDLASGTRVRLAGRDDMDIAYLLYAGRNGVPFAAVYDAGRPTLEYLDTSPEWASLHASLMKRFPGEFVRFLDFSRDNTRILFLVESDRHPGAVYLFDRAAGRIRLVDEWMPWIAPAQMAQTRPVEFDARDGRKLFGFYTTPGPGLHPMVVMPHGGPHGVYDRWGYDSDVQFLASRGYAVLQVNYRGSGGRGHAFEQAGYREWGGRMMDDIADGVRWAIAGGLADAGRICTFGASFGGYAALMQPIRYPDLYQCAIGYVGVYDLGIMQEEGDIRTTRSGRRYLERVLGTDPAVLAANSPARQAGKVKVPVLLAAGRDDRRVPMAQFKAMTEAFADAGVDVETMVAPGEGHGFYDPENRAELYRRIEAFLAEHIGPAAQDDATH